MTTALLALLVAAPSSMSVTCPPPSPPGKEKNALLVQCEIKLPGSDKKFPSTCILTLNQRAFMCRFKLPGDTKSSSGNVPHDHIGLSPRLPLGAVLRSTVPQPKRSLLPICLPAVRSPELNDELSQ